MLKAIEAAPTAPSRRTRPPEIRDIAHDLLGVINLDAIQAAEKATWSGKGGRAPLGKLVFESFIRRPEDAVVSNPKVTLATGLQPDGWENTSSSITDRNIPERAPSARQVND